MHWCLRYNSLTEDVNEHKTKIRTKPSVVKGLGLIMGDIGCLSGNMYGYDIVTIYIPRIAHIFVTIYINMHTYSRIIIRLMYVYLYSYMGTNCDYIHALFQP